MADVTPTLVKTFRAVSIIGVLWTLAGAAYTLYHLYNSGTPTRTGRIIEAWLGVAFAALATTVALAFWRLYHRRRWAGSALTQVLIILGILQVITAFVTLPYLPLTLTAIAPVIVAVYLVQRNKDPLTPGF